MILSPFEDYIDFIPDEDYSRVSPDQEYHPMPDFPIQTTQQLSIHLRSLRKRLGLTQAQLGTRLGVEQARIGKIERNPGSISVEQLLQLLTALESELLVRPKTPKSRVPVSHKAVW